MYTPNRVLHGTTDAATYLQSTLVTIIPSTLLQNVLYWLYYIMCHSATFVQLLNTIRLLVDIIDKQNLKLQPGKCTLFGTEIRWDGRLLSAEGISFDTRLIEEL